MNEKHLRDLGWSDELIGAVQAVSEAILDPVTLTFTEAAIHDVIVGSSNVVVLSDNADSDTLALVEPKR